tara:strand:- start:56 stop:292 length:237 start_codon:yes stop_codon:yes gene_type:complete
MSLIVISIVVVALPPVLVAVIVYVTGVVERTVGVPLISPVDESMLNPFGKPGDTDHVTTGPPLTLGAPVVKELPLVPT